MAWSPSCRWSDPHIDGYDVSQTRVPKCKDRMQAFITKLRTVIIKAAKEGPQIEGQPVDLISLKTFHLKYFEDEVGAIPWKDVPWSCNLDSCLT